MASWRIDSGTTNFHLNAMRGDWEAWNETMPPIPDDSAVSLGYSVKDMPQR